MKFFDTATIITRPYLVQYVSLVLIIFVFTVGAFQSKKTPARKVERQEQEDTRAALVSALYPPISTKISYNEIFGDSADGVNLKPLEAIISVLEHHDLVAEIEVSGDFFEQAVGRSMSLARAFSKQDIAPDLVRLYAVDAAQAEVSVVFSKEFEARGAN